VTYRTGLILVLLLLPLTAAIALAAVDALIAAHGRGVVVRVVTDDDSDDDSYEDDNYHPFNAALEAAGIGVVDDGR
jgi:phosphatidylserine/phosphatidylglycerophosphate/cardiolipin synthase-like enzyme